MQTAKCLSAGTRLDCCCRSSARASSRSVGCGGPTVPQGAARVEPARVGAAHQSLHHFVAKAAWSDAALLAAVRASVLPAIVGHGPIEAWTVDDTGMPKKGRHSVGVARQYCGQLGKQETLRGCGDPAPHERAGLWGPRTPRACGAVGTPHPTRCQVAVSLSVANAAASLPVAWRLYLPREWAEDIERRTKDGVPAELAFQTKPTHQTNGGAGADRSGPGGGHPAWRGPRRYRLRRRLWRGHEVPGAAGRDRAPVHRRRAAKSENLDQRQAATAAQGLVGPKLGKD